MLPTSQSDNAIYSRSTSSQQDELDAANDREWIQRSNSLDAIVSMHVEFSEDDDQLYDAFNNRESTDLEDTGAARIRDLPARKKDIKNATSKRSKLLKHHSKDTTIGIRPRRNLRDPTPDTDVDVE